jgi:hypothetical protein
MGQQGGAEGFSESVTCNGFAAQGVYKVKLGEHAAQLVYADYKILG